MYGFVYLLANYSMPDLYKVGMTERSPHLRAEQLGSTGVPTPFTMLCYLESDRMEWMEKNLHNAMADFRESRNREFFRFSREHMPWVEGLFRHHPYRLAYTECEIWPHIGPGLEEVNPWDGVDGWIPNPCPYAPGAR
jgi:hypothetical protein